MPINKNELTMERVRKALSGFSVCLLLFLLCGSSALAAEIFRETVPLERNRVPLHLERYVEKDGKRKQPLLLVHGVTYSSHEFDVDYKDYSLARYFAGHGFEVWLLDIAGFGNSGSVGDGFRPDSDYAAEDIRGCAGVELGNRNKRAFCGASSRNGAQACALRSDCGRAWRTAGG